MSADEKGYGGNWKGEEGLKRVESRDGSGQREKGEEWVEERREKRG